MEKQNKVNSCGQDFSPEDEGKAIELRREAFEKIKIIAIALMVSGMLSIIVGIIIVVFGVTGDVKGKYPVTSGFSITSGVQAFFAGLVGYFLSSSDPVAKNDDEKTKQGRMMYSIYIMLVVAFSSIGQCIGYSIWLSVACGMEKDDPCGSNHDIELGFNIVACMLGITLFACGISYCSLFYKYRRAFHFRRGNCC